MNQKLSLKIKKEINKKDVYNKDLGLNSYEIEWDQSLDGFAQIIKGKLWVHFKGQTIVSDLAVNRGSGRRRISEGKASQNQIMAPMPGKITKIFVSLNQELDLGEPIIVMEAMKMEYTLKCESKSLVEKILVTVGDQVPLGHSLVKLKAVT